MKKDSGAWGTVARDDSKGIQVSPPAFRKGRTITAKESPVLRSTCGWGWRKEETRLGFRPTWACISTWTLNCFIVLEISWTSLGSWLPLRWYNSLTPTWPSLGIKGVDLKCTAQCLTPKVVKSKVPLGVTRLCSGGAPVPGETVWGKWVEIFERTGRNYIASK